MKYTITKWSIKKLHDTFKKGLIDLTPPYQRNFIWSIDDQRYLIESIKKNNPLPNFFLRKKDNTHFEMVDGQQRSKTIISFIDKQFQDLNGNDYSKTKHPHFLDFEFPVTIITDTEGASIENFYAIVNKTGIHLNKPEIRKADFYNTNYLKLVTEVSDSKLFEKLDIFTDASLKRMNDIEFIAELVVLIKNSHVEKKEKMDDYFKKDLTVAECAEVKLKFETVLTRINELDKTFQLKKTRYKQKNDFYTLFDFILSYPKLKAQTLKQFYKTLVLIGQDIKPSQDKCVPLKEYARNCVTQSNSKIAREQRLLFFEHLFLNKAAKPNKVQAQILSFYKLKPTDTVKVETFRVINADKLLGLKPSIHFKP